MCSRFQSSPVPKDGCNYLLLPRSAHQSPVSILTRPEGRVQLGATGMGTGVTLVSILTRPEGRVQLGATGMGRGVTLVSILTRPEGRVQLGATGMGRGVTLVSILTRPEGRVQRMPRELREKSDTFQSSPVPKDGCNQLEPSICR